MIYYFSGTGNSKYIAEKLAFYTKDECRFIPEVFEAMQTDLEVPDGDALGIVFPVYAWAVPECVTDFLRHVHVGKNVYVYAVCSCASEAGKSMRELSKFFPLNAAWSVVMPSNYVPMFKVDSDERASEKINVARQRLPQIASEILARKETYSVEEGREAGFKTAVVNPLFSAFAMRTSRFYIDGDCAGCGECAARCPFHIIKLVNARPRWQEGRCQMCMACLMNCPKRGIQCGSSRKHGRYLFPADEGKSGAFDASAPRDSCVEIYLASNVHVISKKGITARQLISPANSKGALLSVAEIHIEPGATLERGKRDSSEEIWYAMRGKGRLLLAAEREEDFEAGDVARFPKGVVHGLRNTGDDQFVYVSAATPPIDFSISRK